MKAKILSFLLILVLLILTVWLGGNRNGSAPSPGNPANEAGGKYENSNGNGFVRRVSYLEYTVHARCRMACRHITQEEVKDIMVHGSINYSKSDLNDKPCPTYALEGYTLKDNQHVRIVFAQCQQKTKVATCIDLENDFVCDCK